jgi:uncharacterized protein YbaA (DUF1428 family)
MANYVDTFIFPITKEQLDTYQKAAEQVAQLWKEHGALSYQEFAGDDLRLEGTTSFLDLFATKDGETLVMGWATFASKKARDKANEAVSADARMGAIVGPLMDPENMIFNPARMAFGGFRPLVLNE